MAAEQPRWALKSTKATLDQPLTEQAVEGARVRYDQLWLILFIYGDGRAIQAVWRIRSVRTWAMEEPIQGVRRIRDVRTWATEEPTQGVRRIRDLHTWQPRHF